MSNFIKLICCILLFSIVSVNIQAQTIGSVTTSSTSCKVTLSSCDGDVLTLTPQDQASYTNYKWYRTTVSIGNEITAANAAANNVVATGFAGSFPSIQVVSGGGTYILTAEYATDAGCAAKNDTFELNFTPLPTANPATLALCAAVGGGSTADFLLSSADATITGGATGVTVTYHTTQADARNNVSPLSSPYNSANATIYARVTNNTTGCYQTVAVTLTVNPKPVIADAATTICNGASVDLTGLITNYASYTSPVWTLTTVGGTAVTTPTSVSPSVTTTYVLVAENGSGCKDTADVVVTVNPKPVIADAATTICNGASVDLTGLIINYASYTSPVWTLTTVGGTAVTTPTSVTPSLTTTYVLVAENGSGCKDTADVVVTVNPKPDFTLVKPTACPGTSEEVNITNLTNALVVSAQYKIDAGAYAAYPSPATLTGLTVGNHTITVKNVEGCETGKSVTINAVPAKICLPVTVTRQVGTN